MPSYSLHQAAPEDAPPQPWQGILIPYLHSLQVPQCHSRQSLHSMRQCHVQSSWTHVPRQNEYQNCECESWDSVNACLNSACTLSCARSFSLPSSAFYIFAHSSSCVSYSKTSPLATMESNFRGPFKSNKRSSNFDIVSGCAISKSTSVFFLSLTPSQKTWICPQSCCIRYTGHWP